MIKEFKRIIFVENHDALNKVDYKEEDVIIIIKHDNGETIGNKKIDKSHSNLLWIGLAISIIYIVAYVILNIFIELDSIIDILLSTIYQLALAYCASMIFYYFTVTLPKRVREKESIVIIRNRVRQIIYSMESLLSEIEASEQTDGFKQFDLLKESQIGDVNSLCTNVKLIIRDYIIIESSVIREKCKDLLELYYQEIPIELVNVLEKVLYAYINLEEFSKVIRTVGKIDIVGGDDIIGEYKELILLLQKYA